MNTRILALLSLILFLLPITAMADPALVKEYSQNPKVVRFEGQINYWMTGKGTLEGQSYIESVIAELQRILPAVTIRQAVSQSQANVRIFLTDSDQEWQETIQKSAEGQIAWQEIGQYIRGFTRLSSAPDGHIKRADVILNLNFQSSGGQKLWVVRHELMHALGIMGHPRTIKDTVLNSRQPQEEKNGCFSSSDIEVLQTLYSSKVATGSPL